MNMTKKSMTMTTKTKTTRRGIKIMRQFPLMTVLVLLLVVAFPLSVIAKNVDIMDSAPRRNREQQNARKRRQQQEAPESPQQEQPKQPHPRSFVKDYELWDPALFPQVLEEWKTRYPDLIKVTTAQEAYGFPAAGTDRDCPFYTKSNGCPNYIFTMQDYIAHPEDSDSSNNLPEVFWSGCLHGNERVGPTSVMEAATLLLESAHCESLPRRRQDRKGGTGGSASKTASSSSSLDSQLQEANDCRQTLRNKGIDDVHRKWLARLVATRRIVVVPTANALGYYRDIREEGAVDPNRDFPYDVTDPTQCMQTIAGRTLNEIYREHMFQLALTFHAGMEVVAYEWGAPSWLNHLSPDDEAQSQIAAGYSRYGGGWAKSRPYNYGTMNDMVYYVRGGMEDWAYAGSWTPEKIQPCQPKQFGGYPREKTTYNNSTLRVFNMLVETSDKKTPRKQDLGSSLDVLHGDTKGNGHVSRNVRLALLAAEMVEPYAAIVGVNKLALSDDVVPSVERNPQSCMDTKAVMIAKNAKEVDIEWTVGGAMTVDLTELWFAKWDDVASDVTCWKQPSGTEGFEQAHMSTVNNGTGVFSLQGANPKPGRSKTGTAPSIGPLFRASIPIEGLKPMDKIIVMASARVDSSWSTQPDNIAPQQPPQSHIVNARTNPNWHHESNGKHIHGRIDWFSIPLTIVIGDFDDSVGTRDDDVVNTIELHPRFGDSTGTKGGTKPKAAQNDQLWFPVPMWAILAGVLIILACAIYFCMGCCFGPSHGRRLVKSRDDDYGQGDDFVFEPKPYSDCVDAEYGEEDSDEEDGIEIPKIS